MSVTKCLKCNEAVLIPAGASLKATVRCPLCQEQFELGELLDEMPPPLEIIEDPEAVVDAVVKPFSFDFADQKESPTSADDYQISEQQGGASSPDTGVPAFQFDESSQADTGAGSVTKPHRPGARPQRKEKNPAIEIAKVFGGGLLGIALAIVGIWWIAKKDPFKLGPKVSGIAPWIVPAEFHDGGDAHDDPADDHGSGQENDANSDGRRQPGQATANREQNEQIANRSLSDSPFSKSGDADAVVNDGSAIDPTQDTDPPKVDRNSPDFVGIRNTESTTPEALKQAVNAAVVALTKWAPEEDFDTDSFREDALEKIKLLGKHIATADQQDTANKSSFDRTQAILEDFKGKDKKLAIANAWAAEQLKSEETTVEGILLAGKVKSIDAQGSLYQTRLELLTEEKEEIAILTRLDPSEFSPPGSTIIVIGALVNDPVKNFAGYGGNDLQVICCGWLDLLQPPKVENSKP